MKYLIDFDSVKSFKINIFSGIFELHKYSTMFGKKPAFCKKKLNLFTKLTQKKAKKQSSICFIF